MATFYPCHYAVRADDASYHGRGGRDCTLSGYGYRKEVSNGGLTGRQQLLTTFRGWLTGGRWLFVAAEAVESMLVLLTQNPGSRTLLVLALLSVYNLASIVLIYRVPIHRIPLYALMAADLLFVGLVGYHTGGSSSPFLGQCYLIIFAAALVYGSVGGYATGGASALLTLLLAREFPAGAAEDLRNLVPYFLIAGIFSGSLMERLRDWFEATQTAEAELVRREVAEEGARREMSLARSMQMAALPDAPPSIPGWEVAVRTDYAHLVGGDFYLFLEDKRRQGIVVGDVSGKGLPAAFAATSIGHLLPWLNPLRDPQAALEKLNQDLGERLPDGAFATLCMLELAPESPFVRIWSAGHPAVMHWSGRDGRVRAAEAHGLLLGVFSAWEATPQDLELNPGDVLLLYSDGLSEARVPAGGWLGEDGITRILESCAGEPVEAILEALNTAAHAAGDPADDLTMVVCRYTGE